MPFQKGHKRSPDAGMKPGQKSLKVQAWERLGEYIINEGADRYLKIISNLPDKDFIIEFKSVMEFFKPKLQRADIKQETFLNKWGTGGTVYIGYSEEEEAKLRRLDEQADEQEQFIPDIPPMPKIHIKRDPD